MRSSKNLPLEMRYSVKFAHDKDFRPSARLRGGEILFPFDGEPDDEGGHDTVGAALDPTDGGFWFANLYADDKPTIFQRIWVGKVLGQEELFPVQ
jgi:hypothetical protein